jgi:CheY-like chemotaxis protein
MSETSQWNAAKPQTRIRLRLPAVTDEMPRSGPCGQRAATLRTALGNGPGPNVRRGLSSPTNFKEGHVMANVKRILLVDDEQDVLLAESLWLAKAGYETQRALDGEQAVAAAIREPPDAIVLDVRMPRKDGLQVMAELRQREDTRRIPVVMLSASLRDQQRALDAGATFFLPKPYVGKHLVAAIDAVTANAPDDTRHGDK